MDEPQAAVSAALNWPHQAAEAALEAASAASLQGEGGAGASNPQPPSDVDCLFGLASAAAASTASGGASTSRPSTSSAAKFVKPHIPDSVERRANALSILKLICESPVFLPRLEALLTVKDAQGNTPFMASVANRSYPASLALFEAAQKVAKEFSNDLETQRKTLMSMVYPSGSPADDSPLHVICFNDTCSFTWTGAKHIKQDIFECRTCGLTDSLCCCTECARVCHKGHECKLKRRHTLPTAYCDCWEKCKCR